MTMQQFANALLLVNTVLLIIDIQVWRARPSVWAHRILNILAAWVFVEAALTIASYAIDVPDMIPGLLAGAGLAAVGGGVWVAWSLLRRRHPAVPFGSEVESPQQYGEVPAGYRVRTSASPSAMTTPDPATGAVRSATVRRIMAMGGD